ncbi:MAG: phosphofructokinase [Clostridiaceae bacterium]|jgi:6-phosphofructokinase 1|nr:phosphofructokinase [Clostridiaceae bacterium]
MRNCLVAQSGGPTAVINSSVIGVLQGAIESKYYHNVFAGLNGIEGILNRKIINLGDTLKDRDKHFKYTPSSGLGSCRYKMKDFNFDHSEYIQFFNILKEYDIQTFFYIGGNDSMDTVAKLSKYAKLNSLNHQIIGIPKTIDNDLTCTDHTPGFGSSAKFISTITLETYLDSSVYKNNGIFIIETMGRDTGWLAASACLARIDGRAVADFIYIPEVAFDRDKFLIDVEQKFKEQNQVYIVVSEGIKYSDGTFVAETDSSAGHDNFGHAQLGGVKNVLRQMIIDKGITSRIKTLELGVMQRCAMHCSSNVDVEEAYMCGIDAVKFSIEGATGKMISIERLSNEPYTSHNILVNVSDVANNIKYFPKEWVENNNNISDKALKYFSPLVEGCPSFTVEHNTKNYTIIKKC